MIDTEEALRLAARPIQADDGHSYLVPARDLVEYSQAIRGLTAERDQAVRELAEQKRIKASNLTVMTGQLELARQTIADAPHMDWCDTYAKSPCDCWKAGL